MQHLLMAMSIDWYAPCYIIYMKHKPKIQNIIRILIRNRFYFELPLLERHDFVKDIMRKFPASLRKPMSFSEEDIILRGEK
ncbi:MAG: hypothetical protein H6Q53_245 [Deltaproteobacteria bacterium]|nr:hypothetical protein [Deltaproteobacteria bacterium]